MSRRRNNVSPFSLFSFQDIITATTGILILLTLVLALSVVVQKSVAKPASLEEDVTELAAQAASLEEEIAALQTQLAKATKDSELVATFSAEELRNKLNSQIASVGVLQENVRNQARKLQELDDEFNKSQLAGVTAERENELTKLRKELDDATRDLKDLKTDNRIVYNFRVTTSAPYLVEIDKNSFKLAEANVKQKAQIFKTARSLIDFAKGLPENKKYFVLLVKPSGIPNYILLRPYLEQLDADIGVELIGESEIAVDEQTGGGFK